MIGVCIPFSAVLMRRIDQRIDFHERTATRFLGLSAASFFLRLSSLVQVDGHRTARTAIRRPRIFLGALHDPTDWRQMGFQEAKAKPNRHD